MTNMPENELLSAYLDGELTAEEHAEVEQLLAESAEARQLLDELRALSSSMQSLPQQKLGEDISDQVLRLAHQRILAGSGAESKTAQTDPAADPAAQSDPAADPAAQLDSAADPAARPVPPEAPTPPFRQRFFTARNLAYIAVPLAAAVLLMVFNYEPPSRYPGLAGVDPTREELYEEDTAKDGSKSERETSLPAAPLKIGAAPEDEAEPLDLDSGLLMPERGLVEDRDVPASSDTGVGKGASLDNRLEVAKVEKEVHPKAHTGTILAEQADAPAEVGEGGRAWEPARNALQEVAKNAETAEIDRTSNRPDARLGQTRVSKEPPRAVAKVEAKASEKPGLTETVEAGPGGMIPPVAKKPAHVQRTRGTERPIVDGKQGEYGDPGGFEFAEKQRKQSRKKLAEEPANAPGAPVQREVSGGVAGGGTAPPQAENADSLATKRPKPKTAPALPGSPTVRRGARPAADPTPAPPEAPAPSILSPAEPQAGFAQSLAPAAAQPASPAAEPLSLPGPGAIPPPSVEKAQRDAYTLKSRPSPTAGKTDRGRRKLDLAPKSDPLPRANAELARSEGFGDDRLRESETKKKPSSERVVVDVNLNGVASFRELVSNRGLTIAVVAKQPAITSYFSSNQVQKFANEALDSSEVADADKAAPGELLVLVEGTQQQLDAMLKQMKQDPRNFQVKVETFPGTLDEAIRRTTGADASRTQYQHSLAKQGQPENAPDPFGSADGGMQQGPGQAGAGEGGGRQAGQEAAEPFAGEGPTEKPAETPDKPSEEGVADDSAEPDDAFKREGRVSGPKDNAKRKEHHSDKKPSKIQKLFVLRLVPAKGANAVVDTAKAAQMLQVQGAEAIADPPADTLLAPATRQIEAAEPALEAAPADVKQ